MPENRNSLLAQAVSNACLGSNLPQKINKRIFIIFSQIFFCLFCLTVSAQNKKQIFDETVDRFNFATMEFVLADDKQKPEAVKLASQLKQFQYNAVVLNEKILAVYGPKSKTQMLSTSINRFKNTYNPSKSLSRQLSEVIEFIKADRKDKTYLPQLEQSLQTIYKEAAGEPEILAASTDTNAQDTQTPASEIAAPVVAQSAATPTYLLVAIILIGIVSLVNLWLYYKLYNRRRSSSHSRKEDAYKVVQQSIHEEIYPSLERKTESLERKIENLRKEMLAMLGDSRETADSKVKEPVIAKPVIVQPKPAAFEQKEPISRGLTAGKVVELQVTKPLVQADMPKQVKKYADYPKENGFVISQLQDSSDRRSIYEIIIPPNSEIAQFTIVDNKEIHEYAIQNRERLLRDACDFEVSSSQHTKIEVLKPGKLQKNGNTWQIRDKAQIKFV